MVWFWLVKLKNKICHEHITTMNKLVLKLVKSFEAESFARFRNGLLNE